MRGRGLAVVAASVLIAVIRPDVAHAATVVALWHMDDTGTTMADSSGSGLTGRMTSVTPGQPGLVGTAFGFLTKPSYVRVGASTKLNPGTAAFTVTASVRFTVKPSSSVGDYDLIRKGLVTTAGGDWKMEILQNGYAFCEFRGSAGRVNLSHGPNLATGTWHTISCRRTSTAVQLTVDGSTWTKSGATGTIANGSATFIGAKNTAGEDQYKGLLDEIAVSAG